MPKDDSDIHRFFNRKRVSCALLEICEYQRHPLVNWKSSNVARLCLITGRNEVLAKVIFLHLSVIHSVHKWGVWSRGVYNFLGGIWSGGSPIFRGGGFFFDFCFLWGYTPPPRDQTPEYGQRSAGTHPTGMHSCIKYNCVVFFEVNCIGLFIYASKYIFS